MIGRTMELEGWSTYGKFGVQTNDTDVAYPWELQVSPTGRAEGEAGQLVCGSQSTRWMNKYLTLGIGANAKYLETSGSGSSAVILADGMNEKGLTISAQLLHGSKYMTPQDSAGKSNICFVDVVPWVLGNFATVNEVSAALKSQDSSATSIIGPSETQEDFAGFNLHWAIEDAEGKHIVVEVVGGVANIYDNTAGVMTNDPPLPWQLTNLNQYVNLSPNSPTQNNPISVETGVKGVGTVPQQVGVGYNLLGMPSGYNPASRFVRLFYLKQYANLKSPSLDTQAGIATATGLLNNVFIVKGTVAAVAPGKTNGDFTQWSLLKIPARREFYYKDYNNNQWTVIRLDDLAAADFARQAYTGKTGRDAGVITMSIKTGRTGIREGTNRLLAAAAAPRIAPANHRLQKRTLLRGAK